MSTSRHGRGRRAYLLATAAVAAITGCACVAIAAAAQRSAPQVPAASARAPVVTDAGPVGTAGPVGAPVPVGAPTPSSTGSTPSAVAPQPAGERSTPSRALPTGIAIPAIGVHATFVDLGLNVDGSLQVPADVTHVGWYDLGPAPGQIGPAVVVGHVDSAKAGPGVFFELGALKAGDAVSVTRADATTVRFTVYAVREYAKSDFPTLTVYGNTPDPQLRLITCGGRFDRTTGHYLSNVVVFARQQPAGSG
jgi:sortase (surface protein transpeptidase)